MKKMWGGRFKKSQDRLFWKFQSSIDYDKELAEYDVIGSLAHVKMLAKCKIIPLKASRAIIRGLEEILKDIKKGSFKIGNNAEDIHSAVYACLKNKIGASADYMHTARSRNDQVSVDMRMYVKDKSCALKAMVTEAQKSLLSLAERAIDIIIPGLTHTQQAMPILFSHQVLSYVEMLERDKTRLHRAGESCDEMPLGACALAGTSFAIDRQYTAKLLGFSKISQNSIDAVSDRDFVLDMLYSIAVFFMHVSRFCEDMILFSTSEFGIIQIPEEFCTGSSIMPQKKNPDALELLRASSAEAYANLYSVMIMMKGLPLSYNRDMQIDKKHLFDSVKKAEYALDILTKLIIGIKAESSMGDKQGIDESLFALDAADYLVRKGLAFKNAHDIIGRLTLYCTEKCIKISSVPVSRLKSFSKAFDSDFFKIFSVKKSVMGKQSQGSTNPVLVKRRINSWVQKLKP
jgi:argininosuccinate lyase